MRSSVVLALSALVGLWVTGCVEYEEHVSIRPDGTGTIRVLYTGPDHLTIDGRDSFPPDDEEELARLVKKRYVRPGVQLLESSLRARDGRKMVDFTLSFDRLTSLNEADPYFGKWRFAIWPEGKGWNVRRWIEVGEAEWDEPRTEVERRVKELLADNVLNNVHLRFEVAFSSQVREGNAHWVRAGKVAVWTYRLSDLISQERIVHEVVGY